MHLMNDWKKMIRLSVLRDDNLEDDWNNQMATWAPEHRFPHKNDFFPENRVVCVRYNLNILF